MTKLPHDTDRRHPLWQLTLMRWRIFVREPSAVFWTYGFPVVLALVLGVAFRNRPPEPVQVAIEAGSGAEPWRQALATNADVRARWLSPTQAREALRGGRVSVVIGQGDGDSTEGGAVSASTASGTHSAISSSAPRRVYRFDPTRPESRMARAI